MVGHIFYVGSRLLKCIPYCEHISRVMSGRSIVILAGSDGNILAVHCFSFIHYGGSATDYKQAMAKEREKECPEQ